MAKLYSSCFIVLLVLLLFSSVESGMAQRGEPYQCVKSWECQNNNACKAECSSNYARGRGFCTGQPKACLCSYDCPPSPSHV